ncbi:MAG TPA: hypothetical protein PKD54_05145, partial [Pirellulaceae bacterium]|nr:hypothetical protein [Pirellulaceae bacterium]
DAPGAVEFARHNRLDIMNSRARTVDAFRRVEVSANALRSQFDVTGQAALGTDPTRDNAFRFDSSANTYRMGVRLDGPLNRLNERNTFRAAEIAYQQSRRQLLATEDAVSAAIRADLRALDISKLNFQIARQQYIAVTRQVDEAKFNLRTSNQANSNLTRDLLTSLQGLLAAKNNLINNWFDYKTAKIRLFVDLELLYLDAQGKWINEETGLEVLEQFQAPEDHTAPLNRSELPGREHGDGELESHPVAEERGIGHAAKDHRETRHSRPGERLIWQSGHRVLEPGRCWRCYS